MYQDIINSFHPKQTVVLLSWYACTCMYIQWSLSKDFRKSQAYEDHIYVYTYNVFMCSSYYVHVCPFFSFCAVHIFFLLFFSLWCYVFFILCIFLLFLCSSYLLSFFYFSLWYYTYVHVCTCKWLFMYFTLKRGTTPMNTRIIYGSTVPYRSDARYKVFAFLCKHICLLV